jgi:hypothetical protein
MELVYRGCKYNQENQAKKDRAWWNLVHRPWTRLMYRGHKYDPSVTGGQVNLN